jgi:ribosomal protein L24
MLYNSDTPVTIEPVPLKSGDKVRVIRGKLSGLEGLVHSYAEGDVYICVSLNLLGCAKVSIRTTDIHPINTPLNV